VSGRDCKRWAASAQVRPMPKNYYGKILKKARTIVAMSTISALPSDLATAVTYLSARDPHIARLVQENRPLRA